jgi:hypothetical protein
MNAGGYMLLMMWCVRAWAGEPGGETNRAGAGASAGNLADVLAPGRWRQVEGAVDRALAWLATQQEADGSFPTLAQGQPAVTSFCVMAYLSRGHQPDLGPYGRQISRGIDYVIACQQPDGLISKQVPGRMYQNRQPSHTATYNHAISGLMLGESCGQMTGERAKAVKQAIQKALEYSRRLQTRAKTERDKGGWRYTGLEPPTDSDVSVTAWHLMFLRSAKNAEFDVPREHVEEAMAYVRRCWDSRSGMFFYALPGAQWGGGRGTAGAGIVSLAMGGEHQTAMALAAGDWLLAHPLRRYGEAVSQREKFIYNTYYSSQAAAQLGGKYWAAIYPQLVNVLLPAQSSNGSWPSEPDLAVFGDELTTAMAVLSLTPPYQLLPVYQR